MRCGEPIQQFRARLPFCYGGSQGGSSKAGKERAAPQRTQASEETKEMRDSPVSQILLAVGAAAILIALYSTTRALVIVGRVIRRLAHDRSFMRLSSRNPIEAFAILMVTPGREPGFIRYVLTGLFCCIVGLFVLRYFF